MHFQILDFNGSFICGAAIKFVHEHVLAQHASLFSELLRTINVYFT